MAYHLWSDIESFVEALDSEPEGMARPSSRREAMVQNVIHLSDATKRAAQGRPLHDAERFGNAGASDAAPAEHGAAPPSRSNDYEWPAPELPTREELSVAQRIQNLVNSLQTIDATQLRTVQAPTARVSESSPPQTAAPVEAVTPTEIASPELNPSASSADTEFPGTLTQEIESPPFTEADASGDRFTDDRIVVHGFLSPPDSPVQTEPQADAADAAPVAARERVDEVTAPSATESAPAATPIEPSTEAATTPSTVRTFKMVRAIPRSVWPEAASAGTASAKADVPPPETPVPASERSAAQVVSNPPLPAIPSFGSADRSATTNLTHSAAGLAAFRRLSMPGAQGAGSLATESLAERIRQSEAARQAMQRISMPAPGQETESLMRHMQQSAAALQAMQRMSMPHAAGVTAASLNGPADVDAGDDGSAVESAAAQAGAGPWHVHGQGKHMPVPRQWAYWPNRTVELVAESPVEPPVAASVEPLEDAPLVEAPSEEASLEDAPLTEAPLMEARSEEAPVPAFDEVAAADETAPPQMNITCVPASILARPTEADLLGRALPERDPTEIERIKHRYIIGKRSGKDILNHDGQILIGKYEVITETAIVLAEQAGKLVELIVNMVVEGYGD